MQIKLPNLGEGADKGVVASVLVSVGDTIEKDQTILEVENEKAVVPVPAPAGGKVTKVAVEAGDSVSIGQLLLVLDEDASESKSDSNEAKPAKQDPAPKAEEKPEKTEPPKAKSEGEDTSVSFDPDAPIPAASPTVRLICSQLNLDLRQIPVRGRGGRVELQDLQAFVQRLISASKKKAPEGSPEVAASIDFSKWGPVTRERMSQLRKVISRRMVESKTTVPHVTQFDSIDITELEALRKKYSVKWKENGTPLTQTVFVIAAVVEALKKHPMFRASLDETTEEIVSKDYYHIGIAADTEHGLVVPVIRDADKKSLSQISKELVEKSGLARDRKLQLDDMTGGVFTISNQGGIGGGHFTPVINKPESAILGIGRSTLQPTVVEGKIEPRLMMPVALSYDHRLIDGGEAVRFVNTLIGAFGNIKEEDLKG